MIACSKACRATPPQYLFFLYCLSLFDIDRTEMSVQRNEAISMIDQHAISIDAEIICEDYNAVICRLDRILLNYRQIKANVILLINHFSLIEISSMICKRCFDL